MIVISVMQVGGGGEFPLYAWWLIPALAHNAEIASLIRNRDKLTINSASDGKKEGDEWNETERKGTNHFLCLIRFSVQGRTSKIP